MKPYIDLIEQIIKSGGNYVDFYGYTTFFDMNKKSSIEQIIECDSFFNNKLPNDYKCFLEYYNGGILFKNEDIAGFRLFSTDNLIKENLLQKEILSAYSDSNIILFGDVVCGDADYFAFELENNRYKIKDCSLYEPPSEWRIIGHSFNEFVEKLIKEKGRAFWFS